jgi:hypothetical protein
MAADGRLGRRPCGDDAKHYLGLDPAAAADAAGWAISALAGSAQSSRRR